jgi:hypothetical protein
MARITIEDYDWQRHRNLMSYIDDAQYKPHRRAPTLIPYKVCLVIVCGFTFVFHSLAQLRLCLDYYSQEHHPSSALPLKQQNYGGDHWETQRWFEKLPQYLLEEPKRVKVVSALRKALGEYSKVPGADTGTAIEPQHM